MHPKFYAKSYCSAAFFIQEQSFRIQKLLPFLFVASDSKTRKEPGLGVGYIILIVITVFVFVLAVAAVLIFQYQRKTGRYNFRIKSDNFSYQVFYD